MVTNGTDTFALIGLHDPKQNGLWQWSDGSIVDYNNLKPGEDDTPNFCVQITIRPQDRLEVTSGQLPPAEWRATSCNNTAKKKHSIICSYKRK